MRPIAIINPGSGPVVESDADQAEKNIEAWAKEACRVAPAKFEKIVRKSSWDGDGRFGYEVSLRIAGSVREFEVMMPGVPDLDGNVLHTPRLYVDGDSWWWEFSFPSAEDYEEES